MGFLNLFKQKKEVQANKSPIPSVKPLQPIQTFRQPPAQAPQYNFPKPLDLTPGNRLQSEPKTMPPDLPSFPVNTTKIKEPAEKEPELPRFEKDSVVKDFVSSQPSKPFLHKMPKEFEPLPPFEKEESFETKPLFRREVKSMDRPIHFKLHEEVRKPLFIKTDQFRDAKKSVGIMKSKLNEADEITYRMDNLKEDQDSQLELFHKKIEDVQRKLVYIDKTIFEKEGG